MNIWVYDNGGELKFFKNSTDAILSFKKDYLDIHVPDGEEQIRAVIKIMKYGCFSNQCIYRDIVQ